MRLNPGELTLSVGMFLELMFNKEYLHYKRIGWRKIQEGYSLCSTKQLVTADGTEQQHSTTLYTKT